MSVSRLTVACRATARWVNQRSFSTVRQYSSADTPKFVTTPQTNQSQAGHIGGRAYDQNLPTSNRDGLPSRSSRSVSTSPLLVSKFKRSHRGHSATAYAKSAAIFRNRVNSQLPRDNDDLSDSFSPLILRDMCSCARCVDPSTKQRLFSTFDIPDDIKIRTFNEDLYSIHVTWENDVDGFSDHRTVVSKAVLAELAAARSPVPVPQLPKRTFWDDARFREECKDIDYASYMQDDHALYLALRQIHVHGLLFLTNVPSSAESVSQIAERIGPLKNTFYGSTWDVRSVPQAKNVAYTSQDLGFHMDLLYMEQPPHLQLLHCIRSSAKGGASLFTDSFKAVSDMYNDGDQDLFNVLTKSPVTHHYNHLDSHFYEQSRPTINLATLRHGSKYYDTLTDILERGSKDSKRLGVEHIGPEDFIEAVSWSPPFQAPFRFDQITVPYAPKVTTGLTKSFNRKVELWHQAAKAFNQLVHRENGIYERMMKPGDCVLFDNRRVLHARRAFEVGDEGSERWLRGAYVDKDPFLSKLRVSTNRFGDAVGSSGSEVHASTEVP